MSLYYVLLFVNSILMVNGVCYRGRGGMVLEVYDITGYGGALYVPPSDVFAAC